MVTPLAKLRGRVIRLGRDAGLRRVALLGLAAAACSVRSFPAPTAAAAAPTGQAQATGCTTSDQCASGFCTDGYCCNQACSATEICNLPGSVGTCTPRPLGAPCHAGTQCPSTFCADGVCCQTECDGGTGITPAGESLGPGCLVCNASLSLGICGTVTDGSDPHDTCPGACSACFAGTCGPASVGTNPHGACSADAGLTCGSDGTCDVAVGGACTSQSDCAAGVCVNGFCLTHTLTDLSMPPMNPDAQNRFAAAVAASASGATAVVFSELESYTDMNGNNQILEDEAFVGLQQGGTWQVVDLFPVYQQGVLASLAAPPITGAFVGDTLQVIAWNDPSVVRADGTTCSAVGSPICGLFALEVYADGSVSSPLPLAQNLTGVRTLSLAIDAAADETLFLAGSGGYGSSERSLGGAWDGVSLAPIPSDGEVSYQLLAAPEGEVLLYTAELPGYPDLDSDAGADLPPATGGLGVLLFPSGMATTLWTVDGGVPCSPNGYVATANGAGLSDGTSAINLACLFSPDDQTFDGSLLVGTLTLTPALAITWANTGLNLESLEGVNSQPELSPAIYIEQSPSGPGLQTLGVAWPGSSGWNTSGAAGLPEEDEPQTFVATLNGQGLPLVGLTTELSPGAAMVGLAGPPHLYVLDYAR